MYLALSDQSSVVSVKVTVAALYTDAMVLDGGGGVNTLISVLVGLQPYMLMHTCRYSAQFTPNTHQDLFINRYAPGWDFIDGYS